MDVGFSTLDSLDKGAGLWNPDTRFGRPTYLSHWSAPDDIFGETTAVGDAGIAKSEYNYKTDLGIWKENKEFECRNNARSPPPLGWTPVSTIIPDAKIPPLDSTPIGAKTSDPKTPTTDSSERKLKAQKE